MTRYKLRLTHTAAVDADATVARKPASLGAGAGGASLAALVINVKGSDTSMPLDRCENYTLLFDAADANVATLTSCSVWGAMR